MTRAVVVSPLLAIVGLFSFQAHADQQAAGGEALQLLQKVAGTAQKLSYTGVFVYQSGSRSETSRITRLVEDGNEFERLEVLDGSPREVIRRNDEVSCFLPDSKLLIVERRGARQLLPTLMPGSLAGLTEHYVIRKGALGRVAGVNSRIVFVEPKDEFRFGHQFWIEPNSGLLLKANLIGDAGAVLETFAFTELRIGGHVTREMVQAQTETGGGGDWQIQRVSSNELRADDGQWLFRNPLPGFRRISGMKRKLRPESLESTQLIFSDGLAAISIFLEPMAGRVREEPSAFSVGAVNVYKRQVADHQVIVMGDVPANALRYFGDGIEPRRK
jgi:sigma-E factor negative regulatory protein RseB